MTKARRHHDDQTSPMPPSDDTPTWVADMYSFYREHGHYRALDLIRVVGDPAGSIGSALTPEVAVNFLSDAGDTKSAA